MLFQCWSNIFNAGPALKQDRVNAPSLVGRQGQLVLVDGQSRRQYTQLS